MLAVILQLNLFDAEPFVDLVEALGAAKDVRPDYMVSDVRMPGMTGIELAIAVKAVAPSCKILLFSGQIGAPELLERAAAEGHRFELLQKPVLPKVLVEALLAL